MLLSLYLERENKIGRGKESKDKTFVVSSVEVCH